MPERGVHPLNESKVGEPYIPGERWVDLVHRGVAVSSEGRVRGLASGRLLLIIPAGQENPRLIVGIYPPGKKRTNIQVSTLVAEAFLPPLPPGSRLRVYHKDLDFANNHPANIGYATMSEIQHLYQLARRSGHLPHLSEPVTGSRAAARAALSPTNQRFAEIAELQLSLRLYYPEFERFLHQTSVLSLKVQSILKDLALLGADPELQITGPDGSAQAQIVALLARLEDFMAAEPAGPDGQRDRQVPPPTPVTKSEAEPPC